MTRHSSRLDRWSLEESTAPASEPLMVPDLKEWLRVDQDFLDDDLMLADLITAARKHFTEITNRAFVNTTYKLRLDKFPGGLLEPIKLPVSPLSSVTSVEYIDGDGNTQTWGSTLYDVDIYDLVGSIRPTENESYPTTQNVIQAVTVTFVAGYGTDATSVPLDIVTALKVFIAGLYENREPFLAGTSFQEFPTLKRLLMPHRVITF